MEEPFGLLRFQMCASAFAVRVWQRTFKCTASSGSLQKDGPTTAPQDSGLSFALSLSLSLSQTHTQITHQWNGKQKILKWKERMERGRESGSWTNNQITFLFYLYIFISLKGFQAHTNICQWEGLQCFLSLQQLAQTPQEDVLTSSFPPLRTRTTRFQLLLGCNICIYMNMCVYICLYFFFSHFHFDVNNSALSSIPYVCDSVAVEQVCIISETWQNFNSLHCGVIPCNYLSFKHKDMASRTALPYVIIVI